MDKLSPADRMAIVTDDVELLAHFTRNKAELKEKLEFLKKKVMTGRGITPKRFGRSEQYSALMATLKELFDEEDIRPIIIFQTDGDEAPALRESAVPPFVPSPSPQTPSFLREMIARHWEKLANSRLRQFSLNDIYAAAEKSRTTIYTIIPGVRLVDVSPGEKQEKMRIFREQVNEVYGSMDANLLEQIIEYWGDQGANMQLALMELGKCTGGGTDFLEEPSQAPEIYSKIFSDINRRYVLGYYPANQEHDGKRRRVNIQVRGHPEYEVWGRKSYYAPDPEE